MHIVHIITIDSVFSHMVDIVTGMWPEKWLMLHSSEVGDGMLWLDGIASH